MTEDSTENTALIVRDKTSSAADKPPLLGFDSYSKWKSGNDSQKIQVVTTGGTIDKAYSPINGHLYVGRPVVHEILADISASGYQINEILCKDSLYISDEEREMLVSFVEKLESCCVLITHGTDTINLTAEAISLRVSGKTIVLTGAMIPYGFPGSDAAANVGFAYAAAQLLPEGVYVAMHGHVAPYESYQKNREKGLFELVRA